MMSHLLAAVSIPVIVCALSSAQTTVSGDGDLRISQLVIPPYPVLARGARVEGDMDLTLVIGAGGQVTSIVVDRGPALLELRKAVMEAARQSHFDCRSCDQNPRTYSLQYHFEMKLIDAEKYCRTYGHLDPPASVIDIDRRRISVYGWQEWTCDPAVEIKRVRASKCLYLWKCGHSERVVERP